MKNLTSGNNCLNVEQLGREVTDVRQRTFVSGLIACCLLPVQGQETYTAASVTVLLKTVQKQDKPLSAIY